MATRFLILVTLLCFVTVLSASPAADTVSPDRSGAPLLSAITATSASKSDSSKESGGGAKSKSGKESAGGKGKDSSASPVSYDMIRSLGWRSIGPANMGGRVSEIAFVPGKPSRFFVATATGGVFKTDNAGTTFAPVFDSQPVASTGSVAVAPSDEKIVYVGTGEGNGRNSSSWGNGVYKSTDGGDTFVHLGLDDSRDIPRIAVHPRNPDVVYAAALGHLWDANEMRGVYKTTDGGKTWKASLQIDANTGCIDVALDPSNPETVYAAMYARRRQPWSFQSGGFGDKGGIYRSRNSGATWTKLTSGLPKRTGRIGLAIWAKDTSHLYAIVESDDGGVMDTWDIQSRTGGVFQSTDEGDHWTRINRLNPRPFYFSKIVVDPKDESRVYVLGFGLYLSDDGGSTFRQNGAILPHGDLHTLTVDPADTDHLLLGTDGGVYESRDRAKTWRYIDNIATGQFYELGLGMDTPYTVCGGLQDNGSWCGPSQGRSVFGESGDKAMNLSNQDWTFVWGGDGYYVQIDPRDPNIIYAESQEGYLGRVDLSTRRVKPLRPNPKEGQPQLRFNWNSPIALSKHDPDVLYLGGNQLFKLSKRGDVWEAISPDLTTRDVNKIATVGSGAETHGTIVAIAESPLRAGLLWAGTDDGLVHVTRDGGLHWEDVTGRLAGVPKNTYVARIEASHHEPGAAFVVFDGHRTGDNIPYILETRDFGASWRTITGDLPRTGPVRVVREDPANADLLFAGTEFGPFASFDHGRHWISLRGDSFPAVVVHDIQIHPRERDLVIGTHGRSIYVMDDITGLEGLTPEALGKPLVLFPPRPASGSYQLERGGMWGNDRFTVKNPPPGAYFNYFVKERSFDGAKIEIKDAKGRKVRELKGSAEAGLNRITWDLTRDKEERIDPPEAAWPGQTPFVPGGEYDVTITVGKEKATAKLKVSHPPGVGPEPIAP